MNLDDVQARCLAMQFKDDIHQYVLSHWDDYVLFMAESQKGRKMKITDVVIDAKATIGNELLLVSIDPVNEWRDGHKTDNITAYKYCCVCPKGKLPFEKIAVKIPGGKIIDEFQGCPAVEVEKLELFAFYLNGEVNIGARGTSIRIKDNRLSDKDKQI